MKKTHHGHQSQFLRERSVKSNDDNTGAMNFGSISRSRSKNRLIRKRKIRRFSLLVIAFLLIISAGCIYIFIKPEDSKANSKVSSAYTSFTTDSNTTSSSIASITSIASNVSNVSASSSTLISADRVSAFTQLQAAVTLYANAFKGRIGVYYINLETDEKWGLNEKAPFVAASSIKLGINTFFYKRIAEGAFKFTDMIAYNNKPYPQGDMEPGTGFIIGQPNGTTFSVRRTSQLSITISDNCATNMVIRKLGGIDSVVPYLSGISDEVPYRKSITYVDYKGAVQSGRHRTSSKDLAMHAWNLYKLWQLSKSDYQPLMEDLQNTVFQFGVQAKLPSSVKVAHKIGTNSDWKTENDVGIIFAKEPYVICITTENSSTASGREAVAEISLKFYDYINKVAK